MDNNIKIKAHPIFSKGNNTTYYLDAKNFKLFYEILDKAQETEDTVLTKSEYLTFRTSLLKVLCFDFKIEPQN